MRQSDVRRRRLSIILAIARLIALRTVTLGIEEGACRSIDGAIHRSMSCVISCSAEICKQRAKCLQ